MIKRIYRVAVRECGIILSNPIYLFCLVIFPILVVFFFTNLLKQGQPEDMPVGIVDEDNTSTTRELVRRLDAFQTTKVVAYYPNVNEARKAIQRTEIYAFLLFPKGTTSDMMTSKQPKVSFYYNGMFLLPGSNLYRDLKTIVSLASAGVGQQKLSALGKTSDEIRDFLQPITLDMHMIGNPFSNYNVYLSSAMVPGVLMLFIFLITPYSIGTELKFKRSRDWIQTAGGNIYIAITGKMLPLTLIFLTMFFAYEFYIYYVLQFPHPGGPIPILLLGLLSVLSCQGFGIFIFGIMPSLRMSMSICTLWSVVSFSIAGATYPVPAMDPMIQAVANLFPMRHYFLIYQTCIFNDFPLSYCWPNLLALILFCMLPLFSINHIKKAMLNFVYIP